MTLFVEDIIVDNMVIDILILLTVKNLSKTKTTKWKILLGAVVGTCFALITPLLPTFAVNIAKPFVAGLIIATSFVHDSTKKFFANCLLFLLTTFAFGGASIAVCEIFDIKYQFDGQIAYQNSMPIGVIILVCFFVYFITKNLILFLFSQHKNDKFQKKITIFENRKKVELTAFLDSGNHLEFEKKPITIINLSIFFKLYPQIKIEDILLKKELNLKNAQYIEIESIENMSQKILIFEVEQMKIDNMILKNCILGLSLKNFFEKLKSDAILSAKILEMGEEL